MSTTTVPVQLPAVLASYWASTGLAVEQAGCFGGPSYNHYLTLPSAGGVIDCTERLARDLIHQSQRVAANPGASEVLAFAATALAEEASAVKLALTINQGKAPVGECAYCDRLREAGETFHPSHDRKPRCQSGRGHHCTCDSCW